MRATRGLTLVELLMSLAITAIVMVAATAVVTAGVRMVRRTEQVALSNEASRLGMEGLLRDVRLAGMGAPGGVWVAAGGVPARINPVFGGATGTGEDELWLVVPRPNVMSTQCANSGNSATVTSSGPGVINVTCTAPALKPTDTLMVTNFTTAALIDGVSFPSATTIAYAQQAVPGFSDAPEKGGYQKGDLVFPVQIVRYHVATIAPATRPALYKAQGRLSGNAGAPFDVVPNSDVMVSPSVEDLQVAFGVGAAPDPAFQNGLLPAWQAGLRSLRLSLVGVSEKTLMEAGGGAPAPLGKVTLEDHVPSPAIDGLRRSIYRRRVDLLNLDMVSL